MLDTRAGGAQSIQSANSISAAQSASGFVAQSNIGSPYNIDFTTNFEHSSNGRAWRYNWKEWGPAGSAQCVQPANQNHEHQLMLYRGMNALQNGETYLQWKTWLGRTSNGGGVGQVGVFDNYNTQCGAGGGGGKKLVWWRDGNIGDARLTIGGGHSSNKQPTWHIDNSAISNLLSQTAYDWDQHVGEVITMTVRLVPESSEAANDGAYALWINGNLIHEDLSADTRPFGFAGQLELGGPTWTTPPLDQTMYMWDVVAWQP